MDTSRLPRILREANEIVVPAEQCVFRQGQPADHYLVVTRGVVKDVLTKSSFHPHGIKVRLDDGQVGRIKQIIK